jgi:hypothetical protein
MTLAVHRLAGAAAAIVAGGTIILGSTFLISKSYNLPAYIAAHKPAAGVFYVQTYPLKTDRTDQPICEKFVGATADNSSARQIQPCANPSPKQK